MFLTFKQSVLCFLASFFLIQAVAAEQTHPSSQNQTAEEKKTPEEENEEILEEMIEED